MKKNKASLDDLTSLTQKHALILKEAQITTLTALADFNVLELKNLLDTTLNRATTILKEVRENLPPFIAKSARMIYEENKNRSYLTTGCKSFDGLLGGLGIESSSITEVYAQYGSGKSQFAFSCIVSALIEEGSVIVVDTEGTCSPARIKQMYMVRTGKSQEECESVLDQLTIISPMDSAEQKVILKLFLENQGKGYLNYVPQKNPLKLIVIDSLMGLFRAEFIGRGVLSERQQKINQYMRDLYLFGYKNQIPVLVTNQVMASPDPFKPEESAVGGHVVAHASTYRISIQKRRNFRVAKMVDSSRLPSNEIMFKIGAKGLMDLDEDDSAV